ncbi:hypothetical protein Gorai_020740, partial [Gossypium raimondii]|nr:hypothetical protein [Gossypium raimondii]
MSLGRSVARVRVNSPSLRRKSASNFIENDQEVEFLGNKSEATNFMINIEASGTDYDGGDGGGNKVMVVVESTLEAKGALDWALSHTIQAEDTIVLLHVAKPRKRESSKRKRNPRVDVLLHSMKNMCQMKKPG